MIRSFKCRETPALASGGAKRSEFGEFDALIVTSEAAYLIEAKWGSSRENDNGEARLRDEQQQSFRLVPLKAQSVGGAGYIRL